MIGALAVCGATILTMTLLGALVTLAPRVLFSSFRPVTNLPNSGQNTACCDTLGVKADDVGTNHQKGCAGICGENPSHPLQGPVLSKMLLRDMRSIHK
jgi:hypothetical protein